jgi:hypothetical protein
MSQVLITTRFRGDPVEVMAGWDRMQSHVFVTVGLLDDEGRWRDDVPPLLEAWKEVAVRPTELPAAAALAAGVRDKLDPMGIVVPDMLFGEIAAHIVLDAGNVIVRYDNDGKRDVIMGSLVYPDQ